MKRPKKQPMRKSSLLKYFINFILILRITCQDSVNRVISMVILNASIGVLLKALLVYSPINDLINSIRYLKIEPENYLLDDAIFGTVPLCSYEAICHFIEKFAHFLYLVSLSILLFFYKAFDKKFDAMLKKTLFSPKNTKK